MKRHGKTRGEWTINSTNSSRNRRELLPGEQCQTTHMIWQPLEFLGSFMALFTSDDFSSPPSLLKPMRGIFRSSQWQELFTLFSCIALGSELHHDFCGIFIKIHSEETQILKNCYMTPSTRQLRAEPEGNHTQGESKIHLKILKAKLQRGRERTDIFLLRQNEVADLLGMFVLPKFQQDNFAQN